MKNFTSNSQKIGEIGEDVACNFLVKHGFSILERNYTKKWGEIDIIAEKEGKKYFIEVKSKSVSSLDFVSIGSNGQDNVNRPEENMHIWKMKRLRRVVETYLISKRLGQINWQFDLIIVYLDIEKRLARVKVIDNVIL
ncbi:MAG TPA: YraN family protein [Candidatus Paceibacterota bacterium]|nr:YraN family protein [Candidatus Paceibacterota bacterium]